MPNNNHIKKKAENHKDLVGSESSSRYKVVEQAISLSWVDIQLYFSHKIIVD